MLQCYQINICFNSSTKIGNNKEISRNVVTNILDSLTEDDYVTILAFANNVTPIAECFGNKLVQSNPQNIRIFKENLEYFETYQKANFSIALIEAFEILQFANRSKLGAQCNQAIMIVTSGEDGDYDSLFQQYVAPFAQYNYPRIPIRVFTYQIGKESQNEVSDDMACKNRGYAFNVPSMADVREQVHKYVPIMSRPIVLSATRPFVYTSVYTDLRVSISAVI
ncbi:voltage-dependent calcium channel subunit alpha-2/delta-3-like protein [Leptotrombidium deliense]|uniref:Voltage-dependent calcium channel subunit alpha-2/delta-3-like protein n=1 Tax=Leptotrombidium deliense TaxID=299467 RepID=A0A443SAG8_9ACAR|nr:voltage-dependent calcium channel subunit alpha-2/delta-3-like protein [Leptotrombidium deliense]